jgi:hypothetical protein
VNKGTMPHQLPHKHEPDTHLKSQKIDEKCTRKKLNNCINTHIYIYSYLYTFNVLLIRKHKLLHWKQEKENRSQSDYAVVELGRQDVDKVAEKVECGKNGKKHEVAFAFQDFSSWGVWFVR